jgi:hypothetical protein
MNKYTNFFKCLIILFFICIIIKLLFKFREKFTPTGTCTVPTCTTQLVDSSNLPNPVQLSLNVNKSKSIIQIIWSKSDNEVNISEYIILIYKNNDGPYFIYIKKEDKGKYIRDNKYIYEYNNPLFNVKYKFAVIAINNYGKSNIEKFNQVYITFDGINIDNIDNVISKVSCSPDGQHIIDNKCNSFNPIYAKSYNFNEKKMDDFNIEQHENLMKSLNYKNTIKLKINL